MLGNDDLGGIDRNEIQDMTEEAGTQYCVDTLLCDHLASETMVDSKVVFGVTDAVGAAVGKLSWWKVRAVVEKHVRAARAELLAMALKEKDTP